MLKTWQIHLLISISSLSMSSSACNSFGGGGGVRAALYKAHSAGSISKPVLPLAQFGVGGCKKICVPSSSPAASWPGKLATLSVARHLEVVVPRTTRRSDHKAVVGKDGEGAKGSPSSFAASRAPPPPPTMHRAHTVIAADNNNSAMLAPPALPFRSLTPNRHQIGRAMQETKNSRRIENKYCLSP